MNKFINGTKYKIKKWNEYKFESKHHFKAFYSNVNYTAVKLIILSVFGCEETTANNMTAKILLFLFIIAKDLSCNLETNKNCFFFFIIASYVTWKKNQIFSNSNNTSN